MEDVLSHSGTLSLSLSLTLSRSLFRHVLCRWSWSSSLISKTFIHAWVSTVNLVARNPPPLTANWHFRSASILLVTPQLPTIQSIPEGRNQVPPSHFRSRFTRRKKDGRNFRFMPTLKSAWTGSLRPSLLPYCDVLPRETEYWMRKIEGMACFFYCELIGCSKVGVSFRNEHWHLEGRG